MELVDLFYISILLLVMVVNQMVIRQKNQELRFKDYLITRLVGRLDDLNYGVLVNRHDYTVMVYSRENVINEHSDHIVP